MAWAEDFVLASARGRNTLIKALVCTANCRPQLLEKGFTDTEQASDWVSSLVRWYTNDNGPH